MRPRVLLTALTCLLLSGCGGRGYPILIEPPADLPDPAICAAEPPEPIEPDGARMNGPAFAYLYDWQAHARQGWAIIERERQRRCEGAPP